MEEETILKIPILWRGQKFVIEINSGATLKDLGNELQKVADVKEDTMRLIVPEISGKSSSLLYPFSDEHSCLSLGRIVLKEGKSIRMMGVPEAEVDELLKREKEDLRIAGFAEEERRLKQRRTLGQPRGPIKLPQGTYIFCDFRTLEIPGVELNPPPSEALRRMHMLAADPGIVAVMNKHRWRIGIMTEMAPVGYVGVNPKCILGLNKNHGEEISLRLRTDDLKGFRKYESIKKTLLHELAHMVYSEHDANFYALDKQLNQEAASSDWTRSQSRTLGGFAHSDYLDDSYYVDNARNLPQKIGGSNQLASARAASVTAAYHRQANASISSAIVPEGNAEPDPDDSMVDEFHGKPEISAEQNLGVGCQSNLLGPNFELNQDFYSDKQRNCEPDPDDLENANIKKGDTVNRIISGSEIVDAEPDPDDSEVKNVLNEAGHSWKTLAEPDPDDLEVKNNDLVYDNCEPDPDDLETTNTKKRGAVNIIISGSDIVDAEPDPDNSEVKNEDIVDGSIRDVTGSAHKQQYEHVGDTCKKSEFFTAPANLTAMAEPDPDDSLIVPHGVSGIQIEEPDPDDGLMGPLGLSGRLSEEPDPDDGLMVPLGISGLQREEPDPDDVVLQRIQDPVAVACNRIQKATKMLQSEVNAEEATKILHTLIKIIRNVIEHPNEIKFRRLRKGNPVIQRNVAKSKAALDILSVIGFSEDVVLDEGGRSEIYLVLKRDDPGLLWLAKSSMETCMAC